VLVSRRVPGRAPADVTVRAADLLATFGGADAPARDDAAWRWPLPPGPGAVIETVPAAEVRRVAAAAAATLQAATASGVGGRAVGGRMLRDALLDHVPIVVRDGTAEVPVGQRLVQALVRMGFLGEAPVRVLRAGGWVALAAEYGVAWRRADGTGLRLSPVR
jgi:hypothetical protein